MKKQLPAPSPKNGPTNRDAHRAEVLTIREVAAYLRLPISTTYRLAERRELPGHKVGRQWRFHKSILNEWFRKRASAIRATILVVDDDEAIRQFLVSALETPRRRVLTAQTGEEALEVAKQTDLDLVLLDLLMPGMDGTETFRGLHALRPQLPVIILTGYPDSQLVSRALDVAPFTLLQKSNDLSHVRKAVDVLLGDGTRAPAAQPAAR